MLSFFHCQDEEFQVCHLGGGQIDLKGYLLHKVTKENKNKNNKKELFKSRLCIITILSHKRAVRQTII
jgi:hypothetical protein